jgi:GxxExxY protein
MKPDIYKDEGYKMMGAAFEVYNEQGCGLGAEMYQECMEIELTLRRIPFQVRNELTCYYKDQPLRKRYIPDLFIFGCLVTELKSVSQLLPEHEAALVSYLRLSRQPVGYLINFGHRDSLEWKRIILSEFIPPRSGEE